MVPARYGAVCVAAWLALSPTGARAEHAAADTIAIAADGRQATLGPAELGQLPSTKVPATVGPAPGHSVTFEGPLLWAVLDQAKAVAPDKPGVAIRQWVLVTGSDGFTAALAMAEISPEFEGKPVIVATAVDGRRLEPGHYTLVVPGDQRRGRSVRDVASIAVATADAPKR